MGFFREKKKRLGHLDQWKTSYTPNILLRYGLILKLSKCDTQMLHLWYILPTFDLHVLYITAVPATYGSMYDIFTTLC